jgi:hypothetical protein
MATLDDVIAIASECTGIARKRLFANSAVDQDMKIAGGDVEVFAAALAKRFGEHIWSWPWHRFAILDEGLSLLFPFMLIWQLISWPVRGSFSYPSLCQRLELGHIAAVIDKGEWFDP